MINTARLTKQLGGRAVVSDVTFRCEPGTVTGFLGSHGVGKTTTMRMLVGLSEPDSGHAEILGQCYRDLRSPGRRVGILLDASAQHAGRRGRAALAVPLRRWRPDPLPRGAMSTHTAPLPQSRAQDLAVLLAYLPAPALGHPGRSGPTSHSKEMP